MNENEISRVIIGSAIEVHKTLGGPGLLESVYEEALVWELTDRGLDIQRQKLVAIQYKGHTLSSSLKLDLLVNRTVLIECKASTEYNNIYEVQTLTYLRMLNLKLGLVINFGEALVKDGIHRVVNGL